MWKCETCGERIDDEFEVCWNCESERQSVTQDSHAIEDGTKSSALSSDTQSQARAGVLTKLQEATSVMAGYLEPDEELIHCAYGAKRIKHKLYGLEPSIARRGCIAAIFLPAWLIITALVVLPVLGISDGLIGGLVMFFGGAVCATFLESLVLERYIAGLTNRRFIALRFRGNVSNIGNVVEYPTDTITEIQVLSKESSVAFAVIDSGRTFIAEFHRDNVPENLLQANAIATELQKYGRPTTTLGI